MKEKPHTKQPESPILFRVFGYLRPFAGQFVITGILLLISTVGGFLQPIVIRQMTDSGMLEKELTIIMQMVAVLLILVVLNQSIEMIQTKLFIDIHNQCYHRIFQQVFHKLLHLKKSYFEDKNNTEILSYLQMDASQVASVTDRYTVMTFTNIFRIISGFAGLFLISWKLTLIVLVMVPVKIVLVRKLSSRQEKAMDAMIESSRDFSQWFGDNLAGVDEIKLWNLFKTRDQAFQEKQKSLLNLQKDSSMVDAWNTLFESLLEWSVTIMLYIAGGFFICKDSLSVGSVFAFISYSWYVTGPVSALLNLKMYFARITPSAKRLFQFLDMELEADEGSKQVQNTPPRIEFHKVSFAYPGGRQILNGLDFYVNPGEKIALIGPNGSGKSTILDLLLRFLSPDSGEILADGISISEYALGDYRSLFSVVSQEPYLFLGSIADNIDLTGAASGDEVGRAMKISGVSDYISRMPEGINTQIGRNGARLSGGEKQKLAVARALLKDAPVVILDEATSGFDVDSDAYLHDMILHKLADKSVVMITHRYENLEGMDRVYRLESGTVVEM